MVDNSRVQQAIYDLQRLLRNEVDDCARAIRNDDVNRARREIDDVESKLKRAIALLQSS